MTLDFSRCRSVWIPDEGRWSPPPPHVRYGVERIVGHPYFLLADDMGGMKSAQAIIAAQFLHDAGVIDRVIVVAPASLRSSVWFDEDLGQLREQVFDDKRNHVSEYHQRIRAWSHGPKTKLHCLKCPTPLRDTKQEHPGICVCGGFLDDVPTPELRWIISNYEFLRNAANLSVLLPYCGPKTMLILDESSAVRTHSAAQTEACMKLRWRCNKKGRPVLGAVRCGRVLMLNGTPVAESPMDMFSQGNLLHPSILDCKYVTHYKARYAVQVPVLRSGGEPMKDRWGRPVLTIKAGAEGWTNLQDLQRRFAPYVLRREAKDLGIDFALPAVGMEVALTDATWRHYRDMRDDLVVWLKNDKVATGATAAVKVMRLAQITSGFLGGIEDANVGADLFDREPGEQPKVQEIGREKLDFALAWHAELLKRRPDLKLLTWCRFVPELRRYLHEVSTLFGHPVGATCGEKIFEGEHNQKAERDYALRLLHPKTAPTGPATVGATQGTGALGLNFTACRTVLDMSYDFSPWKKRQGDSRVNRPGQTGPVSFFYLIAVGPKGQRTVDHHIMLARLGKMNINDFTVSAWVKLLEEE